MRVIPTTVPRPLTQILVQRQRIARPIHRTLTTGPRSESALQSTRFILDDDPDMAAMPSATRKPQRDLPLQESRALMRDQFLQYSGDRTNEGWAKLWEAGDFLPWDRMLPSPALIDTLDNFPRLTGTSKLILPDGSTRRKRALVPGCGRGVDVMLLQAYGYDVIGLDFAEEAIKACKIYAKETENDPMYRVRDANLGKGSRVYVQGDFFADDWLERSGLSEKEGIFELIYDYTVSPAVYCKDLFSDVDVNYSSSAP